MRPRRGKFGGAFAAASRQGVGTKTIPGGVSAGEKEKVGMRRFFSWLLHHYAVVIIVAVFAASLIKVYMVSREQEPDNTIVIRIGHWQLESGFRDGINELAEEYARLHPGVKVMQDAIPESAYSQWLSTQFIGGNAPDVVEMGMLPYQIMISFYNRYIYPLTPLVNKPNPYNAGTPFEGVPLRNTFVDGLSSGYVNELQEFMSIPVAGFTSRVFYNKDLMRKAAGTDVPPKTYEEFIALCEKIREYDLGNGQKCTAIVGSKYHINQWEWALAETMTYRTLEQADFNRDGGVSNDEMFVAIKNDRLSFRNSPIEAKYKVIREVSRQCQVGFVGLSRDEGVFLFAQQKAVFISSGTWDMGSLLMIAEGKFELGVMDFPMPRRDNPELGAYAIGPRYDNPGQAVNFVVTRNSKHPEVAMDFMLFLSSKKMNERFNKKVGWIPSIRDADYLDRLKDFQPNYFGIYANFAPNLGGETYVRWLQLTSSFMVNQISYENLVAEFEPFYKNRGVTDFLELKKDWQRALWVNERFLNSIRARALAAGPQTQTTLPEWIKYRQQTTSRQIPAEYNSIKQINLVTGKTQLPATAPYEYTPEALERIVRQAAAGTN